MKKFALLSALVLIFGLLAGCQLAPGTPEVTTESTAPVIKARTIELPMTKATAIQLALDYVGVPNEQVKHLHARLDSDDGGADHYDVDFRHGEYHYAFEISQATGEILKLETTHDRTQLPQTQITKEEAVAIALGHESLTEADATSLTVEFDREDHRYEVKFVHKGVKYIFEICAEYGKILDIDKEK